MVVALGGNALLRADQAPTAEIQRANALAGWRFVPALLQRDDAAGPRKPSCSCRSSGAP